MHRNAPFRMDSRDEARGVSVEVAGRLVLGHATQRGTWAVVMHRARGRRLTLDLRQVVQLDAAGIGLLLDLATEAAGAGGSVRVGAAQPRVWLLLQLTGLVRYFTATATGAGTLRGSSFPALTAISGAR